MKLCLAYSILFFCLVSNLHSQDSAVISSPAFDFPDSVFIVGNVVVQGNSQTKDFVILREMTLKPGSYISQSELEYNKNRIYSLGLFNRVQLWVRPAGEPRADIIVEVNERWYIFPYPIFGIRDKDWGKVFYGVGLLHNNFRGRNEKLSCSVVFGFDPSITLLYRNPFLDQNGTTFLEAQVSYSKIRSRSQEFGLAQNDVDERHFFTSLGVGRRLGIEHTVWCSLGYEVVDISDYVPVRTLSPTGKDTYPIGTVGYTYDSRDLAGYPGYGSFARMTITKFGLPSNIVNVVRYAADLRHYIPLVGNLVLTGRMFSDLGAAGAIPVYNHVYFGYSERIRGHFKEILEGENIFGVTSELHFTLLQPRYFLVGFLPSGFNVWKFGMFATAFGDAGTAWFRGEPFAVNKLVKGYGVGIDVLLPYDALIRMEYALNEVRRGEFILDIGRSF